MPSPDRKLAPEWGLLCDQSLLLVRTLTVMAMLLLLQEQQAGSPQPVHVISGFGRVWRLIVWERIERSKLLVANTAS